MLINRFKALCLIACFAMLGGLAVAQLPAPTSVPDGQKIKIKAIVVSRTEETFVVVTQDHSATYVARLTLDTDVSTYRVGAVRGNHDYAQSYILRGLQIELEGFGDANGIVVAKDVRFKEVDLRTAQSLNTLLKPLETMIAANTDRIQILEASDIKQQGQIDENVALTNKAQSTADQSLSTSEKALLAAERANDRINGLDEYDPIKTINVNFATAKFALTAENKAAIDEAAAWVKSQDRNGWMVEVVGFADSTGNSDSNEVLSEKRADSVINYLVHTHNLPLGRLIQPFGAGVNDPVASNDTAEGRAQNRRVEIRLLLNKGIGAK
jgi:outer membrane protein OmpA-like peptidoglycan-associated protein